MYIYVYPNTKPTNPPYLSLSSSPSLIFRPPCVSAYPYATKETETEMPWAADKDICK